MPIRIGSLLPRSGFQALIGQGCQRSVELAKKMLPDMGYAFEIIDADTESKPAAADRSSICNFTMALKIRAPSR